MCVTDPRAGDAIVSFSCGGEDYPLKSWSSAVYAYRAARPRHGPLGCRSGLAVVRRRRIRLRAHVPRDAPPDISRRALPGPRPDSRDPRAPPRGSRAVRPIHRGQREEPPRGGGEERERLLVDDDDFVINVEFSDLTPPLPADHAAGRMARPSVRARPALPGHDEATRHVVHTCTI
jgi:hypothetical protein